MNTFKIIISLGLVVSSLNMLGSAQSDAPTASPPSPNCQGLKAELDTCLEEAEVTSDNQIVCENCVGAGIASGLAARGVDACITSEESACGTLVGCPCPECEQAAAAYGACEVNEEYVGECSEINCSEDLRGADGAVTSEDSIWASTLGVAVLALFM